MVFQVAAELLDTDGDAILGALAGPAYRTRKKSNGELRVDSDTLSFQIYDDLSGGRNFLVSGEVEGGDAEVRAEIQAIADRLAEHGIVDNLEIEEVDRPANAFIIRHPGFGR